MSLFGVKMGGFWWKLEGGDWLVRGKFVVEIFDV